MKEQEQQAIVTKLYKNAPHCELPVGTRVIVHGAAGYYAGCRLRMFGHLEHTIHFDEGGRQTLRGDRC